MIVYLDTVGEMRREVYEVVCDKAFLEAVTQVHTGTELVDLRLL
jgi:hypothetical protein